MHFSVVTDQGSESGGDDGLVARSRHGALIHREHNIFWSGANSNDCRSIMVHSFDFTACAFLKPSCTLFKPVGRAVLNGSSMSCASVTGGSLRLAG